MQRSLPINNIVWHGKTQTNASAGNTVWKLRISFLKENGVKSVIVAGVKVVICFETCQGMRIKTGIIFIHTWSRLNGSLCGIGHHDEFNWTFIINRFLTRWLGSQCRLSVISMPIGWITDRYFLKIMLFLLCNVITKSLFSRAPVLSLKILTVVELR